MSTPDLTNPQRNALKAILESDRGYVYGSKHTKDLWHDGTQWQYTYHTINPPAFVAWTHSTRSKDNKVETNYYHQIGLKTAGELQNKDLVYVEISTQNKWLTLKLTPYGKQVAMELSTEKPS